MPDQNPLDNSSSPTPPITPTPTAFPAEPLPDSPPSPIIIPSEAGTPPANTPPMAGIPSTGTDQTLPPLNVSPVVVTGGSKGGLGGKMGRKGFVATILGLFLLIGGIGAGLYLTGQNQNLKEKAAFKSNEIYYSCNVGETDEFKIGITGLSESPTCNVTVGQCPATANSITEYSTTYKIKAYTKDYGEVGSDSSYSLVYIKNSNFCDEKCGTDHPANSSIKGVCAINQEQSEAAATLSSENNHELTVTVTRKSPYTDPCGTFQTDLWLKSIDNCPDFTPITPGQSNLLSWGVCYTGVDCKTSAYECTDIRAYKVSGTITDAVSWTRLTTTDLSSLKGGDVIYLTVVGKSTDTAANGGFDKGEFTINSGTPVETTNVKPKASSDPTDSFEFYYQYTVPSGRTNFDIKARVHHITAGWM